MPNANSPHTHTTQSVPAYQPQRTDVALPWRLLVAALLFTGLTALSLTRVCRPEVPGANETGFGVRHEQRGKAWYHCEPWIRAVLRG